MRNSYELLMRLEGLLRRQLTISGLWIVEAQCPVNATYDPDINRCYMFSAEPKEYVEAQDVCDKWGGNLTSIGNGFQNYFLIDQAQAMFANESATEFWIGANMLLSADWSWIDDTPFYYSDWSPGQPNAEQGSSVCASSMITTGMWKASACYTAKPFVCSFSFTPSAPSTSLPPGHCDGLGHYLKLTDSCYTIGYGEDFANARSSCVNMGGDLTSIHSQEENDFLTSITRTGGSKDWSAQIWIGLQQGDDRNDPFKWIDGTFVGYTNWAPNNPSDGGGAEHCGQLLSDFAPDSWVGKWNDYPCWGTLRAFICKTKALH